MISTEKVFGQYVLRPATEIFRHHLSDSAEEHASTCAISTRWTPLTLVSVTPYNHDTSLFCFSLSLLLSRHPSEAAGLDLPVGACMLIRAPNCEHLPMGGDAIRPYTTISSEEEIRATGCMSIMVKRYDEWGKRETPSTHFLFTKTDHTFRPAGAVSNYIHRLKVGDTLEFKHTRECVGRFPSPVPLENIFWSLIAVGVGIAPMINIMRHLLQSASRQVVLLYGAREVEDVLLFPLLEQLSAEASGRLRLVYCIGSRWANIHMGAKTKNEYIPPPPPRGFEELKVGPFSTKAIGWVNEEKIKTFAFPPGRDSRVVVCGLPGVYDKLCGSRFEVEVLAAGCALSNLCYSADSVHKL